MSDDNKLDRNDQFKWGVNALPKVEREGIRQGVGAKPVAIPIRPPSGGSAVPPPPPPKPKE